MPLPGVVSLPYRAGAVLHRAVYRSGLLQRRALDAFTVSVGSLHFGGAGKTPVSVSLAGPGSAVLLRGYGGRALGVPKVLVGEQDGGAPWLRTISCDGVGRPAREWSALVGDEAALVAAVLPGLPVGVGVDRRAAAAAVSAGHDVHRFVLDDGFSHHRLERDRDVLVLPVEGSRVAPGLLREGPRAASRAHALVLVGDGREALNDREIDGLVRRIPWRGQLAACRKVPGNLWDLRDGVEVSSDVVRGRDAAVVCALGRPDSLVRSATEHLQAHVRQRSTWRDHHRFAPEDLAGAERLARRRGADVVLTSLKDAVRWPAAFEPQLSWFAVDSTLVWDRGRAELLDALEAG